MMSASRIGFGLACLAATATVIAASQGPVVDQPAPDFHVTTFDGKPLSLSDFKGQVLILNFWATWCTPCKRELPLLNTYYKFQQKAGLRVVAITTEDSLPLSKLRPLAANLAIPMARSFRGKYGPQKAVPTNYIIDRDGILRYAQAGELTLDALNEILVPMLRAAPATDPTT
jgi:cytochrome c biogenesis protein CcmG, thiol:disulfide interchange protein DsbE